MMVTALQWLHGKPVASEAIKLTAEDFIVREDLGFSPEGEGEHLMVYVIARRLNFDYKVCYEGLFPVETQQTDKTLCSH